MGGFGGCWGLFLGVNDEEVLFGVLKDAVYLDIQILQDLDFFRFRSPLDFTHRMRTILVIGVVN